MENTNLWKCFHIPIVDTSESLVEWKKNVAGGLGLFSGYHRVIERSFCLVCLKFVLFSQVEHEHLMLVLLPLDCIQFNRSSCSRYLTIMGSNQCLGRKVKQCKCTFHIYLFFHLLFSFFFIDSNFKDDKEKYYFIYSIVKTFRSSY